MIIHKYKMNGFNIVLDTNSGAVHVFDDVSYDIVDEVPHMNLETLLKKYPQYPDHEIKTAYQEICDLRKEGLLFTEQDYLNLDDYTERKPVVKALCLHVVHDCNLKCKYCFASQGDFGGHKAYMTEEVGKKALDYLLENSGKRKNLEVDFFGGEPLMDFQLIKKLVAYGNERAKSYNKNFRFTITTNGLLLSDERIQFINEHMHNVVLSLDGRKEIHDAMRPTINDKGSYEVIVPKFKKLVETRGDKAYYIRGTFTKNNLDFSEDVKHFKELGFDLTSIEPVVDADENEYAIDQDDLEVILSEYEKLAADYAASQVKKDPFKFFHFMIDLSQGPCIYKRLSGCGAGNEYLAITPEGDIYPCHQFVGNTDFKMGNLLTAELELPQDLQASFDQAHVFHKEACNDCWAKFYCSGGCHANAYQFNGDLMKPYELGCEMQKKRTECAIMVEVAKVMAQNEN